MGRQITAFISFIQSNLVLSPSVHLCVCRWMSALVHYADLIRLGGVNVKCLDLWEHVKQVS